MSKVDGRAASPLRVRSLSPLGILNAALRAVPALKYALGVAGLAVLGGVVVAALGKNIRVAVIVLGGMLVAMVLLFVFARLVESRGPAITAASVVLLWATTLTFCAFLVLSATAVAVHWPKPLVAFLLGSDAQEPDRMLFGNWNGEAAENHGAPAKFTIDKEYYVTSISNYHWNHGRGEAQGYIGLRDERGIDYGQWNAIKSSGQGGAQSVNWEVRPNITIPPGTYTVVDSHPESWSQNAKSQGIGFSNVEGHPAD